MPNPGSDKPLRKVTLNLYDEDVAAAEAYYGRGWSEQLRQTWHEHMGKITGYHRLSKTLGDLE